MNLNTTDPLLYRNRDSITQDRIKNIQQDLKTPEEPKVMPGKFFENLSDSINQSIEPEVREKISTDAMHMNMGRNAVLREIEHSPDKQKLYNAAKEFESFFVEKMFLEMKKNIPKNEMFHGGPAEDIFDDMLLSERVRKVSDQSEFGLAELMYQQLSVVYS